MSATLRVLGIETAGDGRAVVGVFCEQGTLHVGGHVSTAIDPSGQRHHVNLEVIEIRFFGRLVDKLDEVSSGNVVLRSAETVELAKDWIIEAA